MLEFEFKDLRGKHIYITGGGKGIGAELTKGFLAQGAKVSFVQRADATKFISSLSADEQLRTFFYPCDLSDVEATKVAMAKAQNAQGSIDVLVNCAGNDARHSLEEFTEQDWDENQSVNLRPYFFTTQFVAPFMEKNGGGVVVNYSSASYLMGNSGYPAYMAANAGIVGLTRALARELGSKNIRVNAIIPGWVLTEKQKLLWATPEDLNDHLAKQCLKEHLRPEDLVGGTLFLASNASKMMTGQVLAIDGGVVVTG